MGLNSGPVFGPTFSPFLECTSLLFFAQNKRKTSKTQFLSGQQAKTASTCCTRGDNDSLHVVLTMSFFRHSGGPSNTWQKSRQFRTQKAGLWTARNLNGKLAKSSRNLGRKLQERTSTQKLLQVCVGNRKSQWKPRQSWR